ncbi:MFS transporter [Streptomyces sp. NPDC090026]|uniref:MFS transporter n=1 Tax=Streptomyces sp. NPDC090026 TaxID=3365923 RepID=UPI00382BEDA1
MSLLSPETARRRFTATAFLFWLPVGLYLPSQVLLLTERGLALATVAGLFAVYSLTVAALELPTGGLSDVIGRRPVLAASGALNLGALLLVSTASSLWVLGAAMLLLGGGRALSSGPAEAWYVDTVQAAAGPDAELRTGLARGGSASAAALAIGTLAGGSLPLLLDRIGADPSRITGGVVLPLSVPAMLAAVVCAVFVGYVLTALPEPPRPPATVAGILRGVPDTVRTGVRLGARDQLVRRLLLTAAASGAALCAVELLTPPRAAAATGGSESGAVLFAVLACAGFVCTGAGSHLAPAVARWLGGRGDRAVLLCMVACASGLLLLGATAASASPVASVLAVCGYALVYLALGCAGPNENDLLHRRVGGTVRATALSVQSLALQLTGALAGLAAGSLPAGPLPWLLAGVVVLGGATVWLRSPSTEPEPEPKQGPEPEPKRGPGPKQEPDPEQEAAEADTAAVTPSGTGT